LVSIPPRRRVLLFLVNLGPAHRLQLPAGSSGSRNAPPRLQSSGRRYLALTRYCYYQYCMVYGIQTIVWRGSRILPIHRAIVLHQGGQCRWAEGMKGWLIRVQTTRSETISCKGQKVRCRDPLAALPCAHRVQLPAGTVALGRRSVFSCTGRYHDTQVVTVIILLHYAYTHLQQN